MKSILEVKVNEDSVERTIEEMVLYDHIQHLIIESEICNIYEDYENAFKAYVSIKAILILFEACDLKVDYRYWEWIETFSQELLPMLKDTENKLS